MLKKTRLIGALLVGVLVLTPSISAFAASDESQESEKIYRMDEAEVKTPVRVVIKKDGVSTKAAIDLHTKYPFERDLSSENASVLFEQNSKKVAASLNNPNARTVTIDKGAYQLLEDFTDSY